MNDNAASWGNGTNTRFASTNECDFLLFDCNSKTLSAVELKSTSGTLTYWREDFEKDSKQSFNIKKNQVLGLFNWWRKYDVNCGFVINFRNKDNRTFYVMIDEFMEYTKCLDKKSINIDDVLKMNPIEIENKLLKVNYRYNLDKLLREISLS